MTINRNNCEAVFLDYYEKNLSPVEVAEVLFFLEENPDLKEVFEAYEEISLEHEKSNFPDKEAIKKKYNGEEIAGILASDISRANCEQFFIANAEGILSSSQKEKLNLFLLQYPELKKEHELFQQCRLSAEKISLEGKESLKRELITSENREEYFVRSIENDLNDSEQKALNIFLSKHSEYKKEFELFSKAILPVETISFEDKSSLKKRERKPVFVSIFSQRTTYYAAAAAILLLVGLFFIFRNEGTEQQILADKPKNETETILNVKKESVEPVNKNKQVSATDTKQQSANHQSSTSSHSFHKSVDNSKQPESKHEVIKLQPIVIEDNENLVTEKENEKPKMMEPEVLAEKKQEEKKGSEEVQSETMASAKTRPSEGYQTLGSFARKKIKTVFGIQKINPCEPEDKLTVWDLAMAAKNGVQNLLGTKAVDVNKICDGSTEEYVFTAGNFEFSRGVSK